MEVELVSREIHCEGCAGSIERSLGKLSGVRAVTVNVDGKRVTVDFDETQTTSGAIRSRMEAAGFPCV